MVEIITFKCDRCGKKFDVDKKEAGAPYTILVCEKNKGEWEELCIDCHASYYYWHEHFIRFDKLADDIAKEETGE